MEQIFEKARELGQALMDSDAYRAMERAERNARRNETVSGWMDALAQKRAELQKYMQTPDPDPVALRRLSDELDDLQEKLQLMDEVIELNRTRSEFNDLMTQVNQVLQFMIAGTIESEASGCAGGCGRCSGCH